MSTKGSKTHLYDVLEIQPSANEQDIKKAYRKLAMVGDPLCVLPRLCGASMCVSSSETLLKLSVKSGFAHIGFDLSERHY